MKKGKGRCDTCQYQVFGVCTAPRPKQLKRTTNGHFLMWVEEWHEWRPGKCVQFTPRVRAEIWILGETK